MNPYKDLDECPPAPAPRLSYVDIAAKLLQDQFLLTALELHTELVESGRELPQLREFFSNPGNFEQHASRTIDTSSMHRSPSQGTLDSLDLARFSEDGGGEKCASGGEVAVLEFELRKARETINALRANLTQFADCDSTDKSTSEKNETKVLKPHEQRALNFLINEYLLLQNYKLTSITFSDENPDQDFEDWDDVGLNMPRPAGLISLYKGDEQSGKPSTCDVSTDTEDSGTVDAESQCDDDDANVCVSCQTSFDEDHDWPHEILVQAEEILLLKQKVIALETEKQNFQKLYDAALASLNSLATPSSESRGIDISIPEAKLQQLQLNVANVENMYKPDMNVSKMEQNVDQNIDTRPLTVTASENYYSSNASTNSVTPEQFELIDSDKNGISINQPKENSITSSYEPAVLDGSVRESPLHRGSITTLDDALSINDNGEWTRLQYEAPVDTGRKDTWINSSLPINLKAAIVGWCCEDQDTNLNVGHDLLAEIVNNDKPLNAQNLVLLVADTLPRIIPHTLVSRRCEAAALLACTVHALGSVGAAGAARRTKNLQLLLTLLKKPDVVETRIISEAIALIVKWGGSWDVLSCIAELLSSRSSERRILASQICLSIAPYVGVDLCASLLLSIVLLMCESSEQEIRILGLKAAVLTCPVSENKYGQLEGVFFSFLRDPCDKIVKDCVRVYAPVLARSALISEKYTSDFIPHILTNLKKACCDKEWKTIILYLDLLRILVPPTLIYVTNVQIVKEMPSSEVTTNYQEIPLENEELFIDYQCYLNDGCFEHRELTASMNKLVNDEPDIRWTELETFLDIITQILETAITCKCVNQAAIFNSYVTLFSLYAETFGPDFTTNILKPLFTERISDMEQKMEKLAPVDVERTVIVGIYLAAILQVSEKSNTEVTAFLQRWVVCSGICNLPASVFSTPLSWLAQYKPEGLDHCLNCLREILSNSRDRNSSGSVRSYIAAILSELLDLVELNEACFEKQVLPAVIALLHDDEVPVREVAVTSWGAATRLAVSRGFPCEERCWSVLEAALREDGSPLTPRQAARTAEALALLLMPNPDANNPDVPEKAVSLVCLLCACAPLSAEALSSLVPALQLAAHHAFAHETLAHALRKLEEGIQSPTLSQYKQAIEVLRANVTSSTPEQSQIHKETVLNRLPTGNILAGSEAVGRRVSQMFQQSKNNMNLPNIFKKKT